VATPVETLKALLVAELNEPSVALKVYPEPAVSIVQLENETTP
jgi:hypothetical protein